MDVCVERGVAANVVASSRRVLGARALAVLPQSETGTERLAETPGGARASGAPPLGRQRPHPAMAAPGAGQQTVSAELQQFLAQEQAKAQVRGAAGRREHAHAHRQPLRAAAHRLTAPPPRRPARAQLQQTVSRLTDECWDKCISSPGSYLSSREQACLSNCARRFLDTTQFVVKYFASKGGGGGGGDFQ